MRAFCVSACRLRSDSGIKDSIIGAYECVIVRSRVISSIESAARF